MACIKNEKAANAIRWIIFAFSIISLLLAVMAVAGCEFVIIYTEGSDSGEGLFMIEDSDSCESTSRDSPESWETGSRAGGILAVLILAVAVVFNLFAHITGKNTHILWLLVRLAFISALICQLATFSYLRTLEGEMIESSDEWWFGWNGGMSITNLVWLVILITMSWLVGPPPERGSDYSQQYNERQVAIATPISKRVQTAYPPVSDTQVSVYASDKRQPQRQPVHAVALSSPQQRVAASQPPPNRPVTATRVTSVAPPQVSRRQVWNPDGSVTTQELVTNADGSVTTVMKTTFPNGTPIPLESYPQSY